ncbi:MAG: hypothetical protein KKG79_08685, partial [Acidobacteria bacterium]|nr:hypothetical protein [Acidobacteriota bacterium]
MKKIILFLFLLILIVLAWFGFNAYQKVFDPFQGYYGRAVVQIDSGMTVAAIAGKLQRQGVISRA